MDNDRLYSILWPLLGIVAILGGIGQVLRREGYIGSDREIRRWPRDRGRRITGGRAVMGGLLWIAAGIFLLWKFWPL